MNRPRSPARHSMCVEAWQPEEGLASWTCSDSPPRLQLIRLPTLSRAPHAHALSRARPRGLCQNLFDRIAVVDIQALLAGHFQAARIEAQLVEHGGVDVGHV